MVVWRVGEALSGIAGLRVGVVRRGVVVETAGPTDWKTDRCDRLNKKDSGVDAQGLRGDPGG